MKHYHSTQEFKKTRLIAASKDVSIPKVKLEEVSPFFSNLNAWHLDKYNIPKYWADTKGEGINILMLDTGLPDHNDLKDRVFRNSNITEEYSDLDQNGHQTHCCGIIAGKLTGVAPLAKIYCDKVLNKNGVGNFKSVLRSLELAAMSPRHYDIISMSLGGNMPKDKGVLDALSNCIEQLLKKNTIVVCSAGNSGSAGVKYPAVLPNTLAIAAHDSDEIIASFSSKGKEVDFAAPGVKINSTFLDQNYAKLSGTSMACPFIVGVISLMLSKHKKQEKEGKKNDCKTPKQIVEHLKRCSIDKGKPGKDSSFGFGVISLDKLLDQEEDSPNPSPKPKPTPDPKPNPDPEKTWFKKHMAWVIFGVFLCTALMSFLFSQCSEEELPKPPYIDEQGNIDWDKKFEEEKNKK